MAPLLMTLARGAVTGLAKRPGPGSRLAPARVTRTAVRVDPARLAAYAGVCGFPADDVLPLTYPHILGFPLAARLMSARAFPLPLLGLVHTSLAVHSLRPLKVTERPDLTVRTEGLRPHRRGTEATLVTEAHLAGELVWQDVSTYLARHRVPDPPPKEPAPEADLPVLDVWHLPPDLGRRHAHATGDYNPIHLHPLTARPFGFPRAIAHGMWTAARCAAESPHATAMTAAFHHPVLLPSTVEYAAADGHFTLRSGDRLHVTGTVSA
jgi:MaoC dehydratase-like protein